MTASQKMVIMLRLVQSPFIMRGDVFIEEGGSYDRVYITYWVPEENTSEFATGVGTCRLFNDPVVIQRWNKRSGCIERHS